MNETTPRRPVLTAGGEILHEVLGWLGGCPRCKNEKGGFLYLHPSLGALPAIIDFHMYFNLLKASVLYY